MPAVPVLMICVPSRVPKTRPLPHHGRWLWPSGVAGQYREGDSRDWHLLAGLLFSAGYHSARLAVLAAPELERYDDLGDAAEQGEEPDPQQQQRRPGGKHLLGGPETEQDEQDADYQAEPPGAADLPGRDGVDDVERAIKDKQQPNHRGQRPEGIDRVGERPDRAHQEEDPQQDVRPPPADVDRGEQEFVDHGRQEDHTYEDPHSGDRGEPEPQHDHGNDQPRDTGYQHQPPRA